MEIQKDYLRKLQLTEKEILDEIVRICQKHSLRYYLIGGTLLGAIRHKGFIPWDDDLDIVMPREDYNRFCRLCISGELHPDFYLHNIDTDPEYWLIFSKIRKKNTLFDEKNIAHLDIPKEIFVDIFPLDEAKAVTSTEKKIRTKIIKFLSSVIYQKKGIFIHSKFLFRIPLTLLALLPIKTLTAYQQKLMQKENGKGYSYYVNFGSNYNTEKQTMPITVYEPAGEAEFEGTMYKCPQDVSYVLGRIYGDNYMLLPPEEKRITHRPVNISFDTQKDCIT